MTNKQFIKKVEQFKKQFIKADKELRKLMKISLEIPYRDQDPYCAEFIKAWRNLGTFLGFEETKR